MSFNVEKPEPGIYDGLPMELYHRSNAVGRSALKILDEHSPAEVREYLAGQGKSTAAMTFGTATGMLLLEPDRFAAEVIERPAFSGKDAPEEFRGAGARERVAAWREANADKLWLDPDEWRLAHELKAAAMRSKTAGMLLSHPDLIAERTFVWQDPATGLMLKARPDGHIPSASMTVDVKCTAGGLTPRDLGNYIANYTAHLQAAFAMRGVIANGLPWHSHALVFLRKERPAKCRVVMFKLDDKQEVTWLEAGEAMMDALLAEWAGHDAAGFWPDYDDRGTTLPVPAFVSSKMGSYRERLEKAAKRKESAA